MRDSNSRPLGPKPSTLAIWANPRGCFLGFLMVPGGRIELPTQGFSGLCSTTELPWQLVGIGGLEPPTSSLSETRSNQLSYMPIMGLNVFFDNKKYTSVCVVYIYVEWFQEKMQKCLAIDSYMFSVLAFVEDTNKKKKVKLNVNM